MPWTTDQNGERKYKVSIYAKEELPTWDEMYNQFYLEQVFSYDPKNPADQEPDIYWKLPRKKVLLAAACNQLNKMIFEDGMYHPLMDFISKNILKDCIDIRFTCEPIDNTTATGEKLKEMWTMIISDRLIGTPYPHPIYTFPFPNGHPNPFIIPSNTPRKNIAEIEGPMTIFPIFMTQPADHMIDGKFTNLTISTPTWDSGHSGEFTQIMDFMLSEMKTYFEGEGVGWKDKNGHLIDSDPMKAHCAVGYDPAL